MASSILSSREATTGVELLGSGRRGKDLWKRNLGSAGAAGASPGERQKRRVCCLPPLCEDEGEAPIPIMCYVGVVTRLASFISLVRLLLQWLVCY